MKKEGIIVLKDFIIRETTFGIVRRLVFLEKHILSLMRFKEKVTILDIGCGTGINVTLPLAERGYSILGVDNDIKTIEKAKELAGNNPNVAFKCTDFLKWEGKCQFDVIICSEVLEHIVNPAFFLSKIHRTLCSRGLLLLTVPNGYGYFEFEQLILKVMPFLSKWSDNLQHWIVRHFSGQTLKERHNWEWKPENYQRAWSTMARENKHVNRFTVHELRNLLVKSGFEIIEFKGRTFLAGNVLNSLVRDWDSFLEWNTKIAERLPLWICSGWMIAALKDK
ncbi:TPA: class I SAM-dependent methyltransferase [bacterium]|nr:class I SAM-dependent methyltransferase [bacterium]